MEECFSSRLEIVWKLLHFLGHHKLANDLINLAVIVKITDRDSSDAIEAWRNSLEGKGK